MLTKTGNFQRIFVAGNAAADPSRPIVTGYKPINLDQAKSWRPSYLSGSLMERNLTRRPLLT